MAGRTHPSARGGPTVSADPTGQTLVRGKECSLPLVDCRLQNLEMDRIRGDRDKREAYIRTLERARDSATRAFEDVSSLKSTHGGY